MVGHLDFFSPFLCLMMSVGCSQVSVVMVCLVPRLVCQLENPAVMQSLET